MMQAPTVLIVGTGNVAWHLYQAFQKSAIQTIGVVGRDSKDLALFQKKFHCPTYSIQEAPAADIVLFAVSDNAISALSEKFKSAKGSVMHTSGSLGLDELHPKIENKAVFYPFQTFSINRELNYSQIPIFSEYNSDLSRDHINYLSKAFSNTIHPLTNKTRVSLHLAGVLTNNFTNVLLNEANKLLEQNKIPREVLWPLLLETIEKAKDIGPENAQTGPAIRRDSTTIEKHLLQLEHKQTLQNAYKELTQLIQERFS